MHDKPFTAAIYLLIGVILAFGPILAQLRPGRAAPVGGGGSKGWMARPSAWQIGCIIGLLLGLSLLWWRRLSDGITLAEAMRYAGIVAVCLWGLFREVEAAPGSSPVSAVPRWTLLAVAAALTIVGTFGTGVLESSTFRFVAWHHWGAFTAPAEDMKSGGRIFHDFPAQYGLGPTTLLAAACRHACWGGMYLSAATANFVLVAIGLLMIGGLRLKTTFGLAVALAAAASAMLFWVAYPAAVGSPTVTPSVGGLRFLPPAALAALLWWIESYRPASRRWAPLGFGLFAIGALWSPESLFMSLAVWGPYYCLRRLAEAPPEGRLRALILALAHLALALAAIALAFVAVYGALFHVLPKPRMYLIYMLFPPGPLPINPWGAIWFCGGAVVLGAWTCWRLHLAEGNSPRFRAALVLVLLAYASISYAMGRSHDNNFLNLMPYFVLMLASAFALRLERLQTGIAAGMLVSLLGLLTTFNWSIWSAAPVEFKGMEVANSMSFRAPTSLANFPAGSGSDAAAITHAIDEIHGLSKDPIELIDPDYLNLSGEPIWTTLHGAANLAYIPEPDRVWIVREGAKRYRRNGWLLISNNMTGTWLNSILPAYTILEERDYPGYRAFHLTPRP